MTQWWSWALTAVGVTGLWLAGRKSPWGWAVGIGAQVLWLAYASATGQWGFLVSCFAYGFVYIKNFRSWRYAEPVRKVGTGGSRPPMASAQITEVVEGILDDYLGDSEPVTRHRETAEALTESWLKDRNRATCQAAMATGSSPSGGPS